METRSRFPLFLAVAVLAAFAGIGSAYLVSGQRQPETPDTRALVLQAPRALPEFRLTDHRQQAFGPDRLQGRWTMLFFGFTHCPDVCPTTLNTLSGMTAALQDLPPASRPAVVMISVDPMRDTAETLSGYVPFFNPDFLGVTGEMGEIMALTRGLGVAFAYQQSADGGEYTVEHTASLFLIDPRGRLAAIFNTPHRVEELDSEYRQIVGQHG